MTPICPARAGGSARGSNGRRAGGVDRKSESAGLFLTSTGSFGRLCHGILALLAWNRKQHLALPLIGLAAFRRRSGCGLFLCNTTAERFHEVDDILRPWRLTLARYSQAGL